MKALFLFITLLFSTAYAQKASFKEIKLRPNPKLYDTKDVTIIYPIIVTSSPAADKLMNDQIKVMMLDPGDAKQTTRALLTEHTNDYGLTDLSYEVTYNKFNLLSMHVFMQGCGAYCSSGDTYFNFDLKTGKIIGITDLIMEDKLDSFRNLVYHDKLKALQEYKLEEIGEIKQDHIDTTTYNWIMEEVDSNCSKSISLENILIAGPGIEIIDLCEFPHIIRSQEPTYHLKYSYQFLYPFLKPKFKTLLFK